MRVLLLFRGSAGCGKSTYIKEHGLEPFTLCADNLRMLCSSPKLKVDGTVGISQDNERIVWNTLFQILETRMQNGEFTVIDATNSKTSEMNRYKDLASAYRYRIYCVDMTDIPIEETKKRNASREELKRVPEEVIDKMYARFATQPIPSGIKVIKPDNLDDIWFHQWDMNEYDKIHVIGDIHGCNSVLQDYLKIGIKEYDAYIFLGDYLDRGIENAETLKFLLSIYKRPNVVFLEGNHEIHLRQWASGVTSKSKEFERITRPQLEAANIDKKEVREFCRKLGQCVYAKFDGKNIMITHGGISNIPDNLTKLATIQMIKGVGSYADSDAVDESFVAHTELNTYSIHGHRNVSNTPIECNPRVYNLNGEVEFGGKLRTVTIRKDPFDIIPVEITNKVFKAQSIEKHEIVQTSTEGMTMEQVINLMRSNANIEEKAYGNIHSLNFTRNAFEKSAWDDMTIKARGMFVDIVKNKVAARSWNKFFNVGERPETKLDMLSSSMEFPAEAFVKYNGFLGMVSWDYEKNDFLIATKSSLVGEHAEWLKNDLYNCYSLQTLRDLENFIKANDVTFVFECCDTVHDRHIISYPSTQVVLLDIIYNQLEYKHYSYNDLTKIANTFGLVVKERAAVFTSWEEFFAWYNEVMEDGYEYHGVPVEGFVVTDANGFMVKIKTEYYRCWKKLRGVAQNVLKSGNFKYMGSLLTPEENYFYKFCMDIYKEKSKEDRLKIRADSATNICALRDKFYSYMQNKKFLT